MIATLNTSNETLRIVLAGAKTSLDATYTLMRTGGNGAPHSIVGKTNGTTAVVMSTGDSPQKVYDALQIVNNDTGSITVTVNKRVVDSAGTATDYPLISALVMLVGDSLMLSEYGIVVTNSSGQSGGAAVPSQLVGVTAGTVAASKALVVDANKDLASLRDVTTRDIVARNIAPTGGVREVVTAVAAAGTVQGDAAALSEGINIVSAADDAKGVLLPVAVVGMCVTVKSTVSNKILKVWPNTGAAINAIAANSALSLASGPTPVILKASSATQWYSIPLLPS